ncbi:mechanosensitive ion channel family protein [Novosphingobium sp.]|uniref:mechanosensitive ion channel family protein n=1 Tax=Novosphingobium sp. TaxID=1874826 RepID=UPI002733FC30|nr:mechanosensitive ion channel domain-containing protein [Novosphingobium sp.]MDP3908273.1 mechanosensitive ion channel [Novosphingobium sp.]
MSDRLPSVSQMLDWSEALTLAGIHVAIAAGAALGFHFVLFKLLDRAARLSASTADELVFARLRHPLRWSLVAVAISVAAEANGLIGRGWDTVARFLVPALMGWVAFAMVKALAAALEVHAGVHADPVAARSRRTRIALFSRSAGFMVVFVTVALILFSIPAVRNVGVTLIASAGFATLTFGLAAQPALKSLIAGIQIALTEPIRIGDFVVIDNESGRIEDIRLSYVVIRTADERRIIVPTAKFLDSSFQNWTRVGLGLTGSVVLPVRPGSEIAPIRAAYEAALAANPDWDKRTAALQVSEARVGSVELKLVMSADGPTELARLRHAMREAMLEWLRENMPSALCTET